MANKKNKSLNMIDSKSNFLDKFIQKIGGLLSWLILLAMIISVYEVFARYLFDSPTAWVHELTVFLVASIFILGGPYALAKNKHIQITLLYDVLSKKNKKFLKLVNLLLSISFCICIGYAAYILAYQATRTPGGEWYLQTSGSSWNSPLPAFMKIIILISIILMTIQLLIRLFYFFKRDGKED